MCDYCRLSEKMGLFSWGISVDCDTDSVCGSEIGWFLGGRLDSSGVMRFSSN